MLAIYGMVIFGAGFIACASWYFWPVHKPQAQEPIAGSIFVSCEMTFLPIAMPTDGRIEVAALSPEALENTAGKIIVSGMTDVPGSKINWPKTNTGALNGWRCEITNDTATPLLEVSVPMRVTYGEQGKERTGIFELVSTRLDTGASNRRTLYIYNKSPEGGSIVLSETGSAYILGQKEKRQVQITRPLNILGQFVLLFPFFSDKTPPTQSPATVSAPAPPNLPMASLRYGVFRAEVTHSIATKATAVQMMVEMRNTTDHLMYFRAKLNGNIARKTSPNGQIEFTGNIPPGDNRRIMYDRIPDVPVNETNREVPVLYGVLDYDITYWIDNSPQHIERRTAKRVEFSMWRPFDKTPPVGGQIALETTVRLSNEIEE